MKIKDLKDQHDFIGILIYRLHYDYGMFANDIINGFTELLSICKIDKDYDENDIAFVHLLDKSYKQYNNILLPNCDYILGGNIDDSITYYQESYGILDNVDIFDSHKKFHIEKLNIINDYSEDNKIQFKNKSRWHGESSIDDDEQYYLECAFIFTDSKKYAKVKLQLDDIISVSWNREETNQDD